MADEIAPVEAVAPTPAVDAAPVVETPVVAAEPVVETAAEPVAEVVETAPAEAPAAEPVAEGEKPVEAAPAEEAKAAEPEPVKIEYADFTMPEGVKAAPEQIEAFTGVLSKYGLSQEVGQELMDLHAAALRNMAEATTQNQQDVFMDVRRGWRAEVDKQFGNRRDTVMNEAKAIKAAVLTDAAEIKAFNDMLDYTGVGDHPAMVNFMAKAARRISERSAPPPGLSAKTQTQSAADRRYGQPAKR